jgi:hypothetical protein
MNEQEKYRGAFIAADLPHNLYLCWIGLCAVALSRSKVGEFLPPFSHMTIYYLGNINNSDLNKAKQVLKKSITFPDKIFGIKVSPKKVDIIGDSEVGNYLIFSLQASKNLEGLRQRLEKGLPEFYKKNLPFKPHLTLGQIDPDNLNFSSEFVSRFEPDPHYGTFIDLEKIGIFCKPEDKTKGVTELYSIELCPKF